MNVLDVLLGAGAGLVAGVFLTAGFEAWRRKPADLVLRQHALYEENIALRAEVERLRDQVADRSAPGGLDGQGHDQPGGPR